MGKFRSRAATLLIASTLTVMAGAIVAPALPEISRHFAHIAHGDLLTRLILTLPALVIGLLSPIAGYFADRMGRRSMLLFSLVFYALAGTSGAWLSDIYYILVGRMLLGVAVAGIMTSVVTLIGDYYLGESRSRFMGYQAAFAGLGGLLFITSGGVLADFHWRFPFVIYGLSIGVFIMAWFTINEPAGEDKTENMPGSQNLRIPRVVYLIYVVSFFSMAIFYMIPVQMPFMLSGMPGVTSTQVGLAIALMNVTSVSVSLNYARIKKYLNFLSVKALVYFLVGVGYLVISQSNSYWMAALGILICGLGFGMLMANINLWLISKAPAPMRGRLVGYLNAAIFMGMFLSPVLLHPLVKLFELQGSFLIVSMLLMILAVLFSWLGYAKANN